MKQKIIKIAKVLFELAKLVTLLLLWLADSPIFHIGSNSNSTNTTTVEQCINCTINNR